MLVDDHPSFRAAARWLLETEGYVVVAEAANGESALELVVEADPDLVLLDIGLPRYRRLPGRRGDPGALPGPCRADLEPRAVRPRRRSRDRLRRGRLRAQGRPLARRAGRGRSASPPFVRLRRPRRAVSPVRPQRRHRGRHRDPHTEQFRQRRVRRAGVRPLFRRRQPGHRRGVRAGPDLGRAGRRLAPTPPPPRRSRSGATRRPRSASWRCCKLRRRRRGPHRRPRRRRGREHRQAARAHGLGGDPPDGRPAPLLRGRRARARGPLGGRVHARHDVVHPPRADRRRRPGHALELPAADGDLEGRPGARGRQHDRAQAQRHDAASRPC